MERKELMPQAEPRELGIEINFETVNGNDLQPRVTTRRRSSRVPDPT